jgi:hypothetical protein
MINTYTRHETCLAGKTNLPVNVRAESQKIAVWIYTALPCTTPRPAPKSSTDDLAWDLWARPPPKGRPYFGWVSRRRGCRSLTDHAIRSANDRGSRINSTDQAFALQTKGRNPPPQGGLYSLTETGLVMATQIVINPTLAYHCLPPASILPSEAFRYNQPDVASHHWPLDQVREPTVRTCGSSRTSQDYYRNNLYSIGRQ